MRVDTGKSPSTASVKRLIPEQEIHINTRVYFCSSLGRREIFYMFTKTLERITGLAHREREYDALERERLKTDQITEASERLNGAMENVFEYEFHDGDFYFQGQALRPIFERGITNTEEIVKTKPQFGVELLRRHIELKQYEEQTELIQNVDWQNPLVLVHISPTPDAVLEGGVDLNAYDPKRKKIMVRISEPTIDGLKVTSMSLDGGDRVALQAVGDFFGVDISDDASSEDILSMRFLAEKSQFNSERPAKVLREVYDKAMRMQYGGEWYAGRQDSAVLSTMERIMAYPGLVEQHVDDVWRLKKRFGNNFRFTEEYDKATYDFLAAIEASHKTGKAVKSIGAAGGAARAAGMEFAKSDCPTGQAAQTAEQALAIQGINEKYDWKYGQCQVCLAQGLVGACSVCASCENADNAGKSLDAIHKNALARLALEKKPDQQEARGAKTVPEIAKRALFSDGYIKKLYGEGAKLERRKTVGDEKFSVVDDSTGLVIEEDLKKSAYALGA